MDTNTTQCETQRYSNSWKNRTWRIKGVANN